MVRHDYTINYKFCILLIAQRINMIGSISDFIISFSIIYVPSSIASDGLCRVSHVVCRVFPRDTKPRLAIVSYHYTPIGITSRQTILSPSETFMCEQFNSIRALICFMLERYLLEAGF